MDLDKQTQRTDEQTYRRMDNTKAISCHLQLGIKSPLQHNPEFEQS